MFYPLFYMSDKYVSNKTFEAVEQAFARKPELILPVSSIEPVSSCFPLGFTTLLCEALTVDLSKRTGTLFAPVVQYGCAVPYMAFGGVAGVKTNTLTAVCLDLLGCWTFQGVTRFLVLDSTDTNRDAVDEAVRRFARQHAEVRITVLRWQDLPSVKEMVGRRMGTDAPGRCEAGLFAMAGYLAGTPTKDVPTNLRGNEKARREACATWLRRGRDPARFRKLFPDAMVSPQSYSADAGFGEQLYLHILDEFERIVEELPPAA